MERTHLARHDLDWLPPSLKAVRWTVAGGIWTGIVGLFGALAVVGKVNLYVYGKGFTVLAGAGFYAGDRAARAILRRRLGRLARGDVDLTRLSREADGELVHVRGRVRARATIPGFVDERQAVFRRVTFVVNEVRVVHEAAVDFSVIDDAGGQALVEVAGARLVVVDGKRARRGSALSERVLGLPLPPSLDKALAARRKRQSKGKKVVDIPVGEYLLTDGAEVEVVGYKSRVVDPTVAERLERDTPMRATLRAGHELPLLIAPV
jgi:hypothetical protein